MFCVCVGRAGLPSVMLVYGGRLLCLCTVGMRARCSGSVTRDTGVDCLNLYHLDWSTPNCTDPPAGANERHELLLFSGFKLGAGIPLPNKNV